MTSTLPVVEMFGPTVQGEGPHAGRRADFIRFGGCNLSCSWCDTPYSWDASRFDLRTEITARTVASLLDAVTPGVGMIVLTGGEPLLHARTSAFQDLLQGLAAAGVSVHVETNGTILPPDRVANLADVFIVSPKLPNAGLRTKDGSSHLHDGWAGLLDRADVHLKIVCENAEDVARAVVIAQRAGFPHDRTWVMPQAADASAFLALWQVVADAAIREGVNVSPRLHLLAWGTERGR